MKTLADFALMAQIFRSLNDTTISSLPEFSQIT
jgi:hypothetical protein